MPITIVLTKTDVSCAGNDGTITAVITGGTPPFTYLWTKNGVPFSVSQNLTGLSPGVYSLTVNGSVSATTVVQLYNFASTSLLANPFGAILEYNGFFYGTTRSGGANGVGGIYKFDPATNTETTLYDFNTTDGALPLRKLTLVNVGGTDYLYGITQNGGAHSKGTLFQFDPALNTLVTKVDFDTAIGDSPFSELTNVGGILYGTTIYGGSNNFGALYSFNTATDTITVRHSFQFLSGAYSSSAGLLAIGLVLYGVSEAEGKLFSYNTSTNTYTPLHTFVTADGTGESTTLMQAANGLIYGCRSTGGANGEGTLFYYNPSTGIFFVVHDFILASGRYPQSGEALIENSGSLWGVANGGGANSKGVIFSYNSTSGYVNQYDLDSSIGALPFTGLTYYNGKIYGTCYYIGVGSGTGSIFSFIASSDSATEPITLSPFVDILATAVITSPTCSGDMGAITLTTSGGASPYTYLWSNGATTQNITDVPGTYSVTITDDNGCTAIFSFVIPAKQAMSATIDADLEHCYEGAIAISVNTSNGAAPLSYLWNTAEETQSISALAGHTYYVVVTDSNGCMATAQVSLPTQIESYLCCLVNLIYARVRRVNAGMKVCKCSLLKIIMLSGLIGVYRRMTDFIAESPDGNTQITTHARIPFAKVTSSQKVAQSFVPTSQYISAVTIKSDLTGPYTGDVIVSIYTDSNGVPGDLIGSGTITNQEWFYNLPGLITVNFTNPLKVTAGQTHWIVISSTTYNDTDYPQLYGDSNTGYGGTLVSSTGSSWGELGNYAIYFQTTGGNYRQCLTSDQQGKVKDELTKLCGCCGCDGLPQGATDGAEWINVFTDATLSGETGDAASGNSIGGVCLASVTTGSASNGTPGDTGGYVSLGTCNSCTKYKVVITITGLTVGSFSFNTAEGFHRDFTENGVYEIVITTADPDNARLSNSPDCDGEAVMAQYGTVACSTAPPPES